MNTTSVRLPDDLKSDVESIAKANGLKAGDIIRMAITRLIAQAKAGEPIQVKLEVGAKA